MLLRLTDLEPLDSRWRRIRREGGEETIGGWRDNDRTIKVLVETVRRAVLVQDIQLVSDLSNNIDGQYD